jgi:hypothetical protein
MTAINVVVGTSAVHMVTDGVALRSDTYAILGYTSKVITLPHLPAAIVATGPVGLVHRLGSTLFSRHTDVDALMFSDALDQDLKRLGLPLDDPTAPQGCTVRIAVIGYSRRSGHRAWCSRTGRMAPLEAGDCWSTPAVAGDVPSADRSPEAFERGMLRLIERQRKAYPIGGPITLTTIRGETITQKVLQRYPDRVGDIIKSPAAAGAPT